MIVKKLSKFNIFLIVVLGSTILLLFAFFYYKAVTKDVIKDKNEFLHAVTELKLEQVINWKKGRTADAKFFATIGKFIKYTDYLLINKNTIEAKEYLSKTLKQFINNGYDENIVIADTSGKILFSVDSTFNQFDTQRIAEIKNSFRKDSVIYGDFYFNRDNKDIRLNIISVIKNNGGAPIAAFIQIIDPNKSLIKIIQKFPSSSKTAEILIFKKENESIIYLNELRHKKNAALNLKIPLSQVDVVAVKGALGKSGIIEGKDYRGIDVFAELQPITGTEWYMVSKIDKDELYSELYYRAGVILIIVLISILLISLTALYIYKQQQSRIYKNLFLKQKELIETQEEYKTALYSIGDGVITTDTKGVIRQMNPVAEKLTGWKENEAKGLLLTRVFNIVNEETGVVVENPVELVLRNGLVVGLANHTILISKDGRKVPIADSGSPIQDDENKIIGVILVFRDRTEERLKEKLILESEEKFRKAFTTSPDSININRLDDGMYISVNRGFLKMTGYTESEVIGKTSVDINIWADIEDRDKLVSLLKENGIVENFEARFRLKSGEIRWGLMSASLLDLNSQKHILSLTRDISERKLAEELIKSSEEKYRMLLELATDAFFQGDRNGYFITVNSKATDLTGYSKEELLKLKMDDLFPKQMLEKKPLQYEALNSGQSIKAERTLLRKDGRLVEVEMNSRQMPDGTYQSILHDITESKQFEKALMENQMRLQSIVSNAPVIIFGLDSNGVFTFSEGKGLAVLGLKPGEVVGRSALEVYKDFPEIVETLKRALRGEILSQVHDMGNWVFDVYYSPVKDENNRMTGLIGVATDITDNRKAEAELKKLSITVEQSPVSILITDTKGNIEYVNPKFSEISGYSFEELKGQNPRILSSGQMVEETYKEMWGTILSGKEWHGEFYNKKKNGELYWESASISPIINSSGQITHFVAVKENISEKKKMNEKLMKSEEQFRSIWENSVDAMRLLDENGIVININDAYSKLFEVKKEEVIGKLFNSSYKITESESKIDRFKERLRTKEIQKNFETKLLLKNGKDIWAEFTNSFIGLENEKPFLLSIIRNITDRKNIIVELTEAKNKAEEMNRLKAFFFANMSHELRTPFVGIMGFAEILAGSLINDEEREMAAQILKSSKRLTDTLNKILNVTRLEFDKIDLVYKEFDVCQLLQNIESLYSSSAKLKNTVISTVTENQKILFKSDPRLLEEILTNLVSNAVKFTENGLIKLIANIALIDNQKKLIIKVEDNGIGIPKDKQHIVWYEFRQVSEGLNRSFEGSGLGLTITKKYTEMLGGEISLESEVNVGSKFTIKLPVNDVDLKISEKTITADVVKPISKKLDDKKNKILYVEDDVIALNYITIVLRSLYDVTTAFSAKAALENINTTQFDLLMLDINLGKGMDGVELMQQIRGIENYKTVPIVAVTAYAAQSDKEEFLAKGFTHYISKPFTSRELKDLLNKVFD